MEKIDEDFHLHGELPHQLNADEPNEKDTHEFGDNESVIEFFDTLPALRPNNYVPFTRQVKMIKRKHGITDNNITPHQPCNTLSPTIGNKKHHLKYDVIYLLPRMRTHLSLPSLYLPNLTEKILRKNMDAE